MQKQSYLDLWQLPNTNYLFVRFIFTKIMEKDQTTQKKNNCQILKALNYIAKNQAIFVKTI